MGRAEARPSELGCRQMRPPDKLRSDNEENFSDFFSAQPATPMAEPTKDTVRIALPPRLETEPGPQNGAAKQDPAGIALPSRAAAIPESLRSRSEPAGTENFGGASIQPGLKKDTARISSPPRPAKVMTQTSPVVATSNAADAFDSIPRWFCWGLLSLSALIFLIQIWNYAVS